MEDAAIAYGYDRIRQTLVESQTLGLEDDLERRTEEAREIMVGLGFIELMGIPLTCHEQSDGLLRRPPHPATVLLDNPISSEQTQLRTSLLPGILPTLARNRHHPLPQQVFEAGDVTLVDPAAETGGRERRHLAFGLIAPRAGFADLRALCEAVARELGWPRALAPASAEFLLEGRAAWILAPGGKTAGLMGEVHPQVLEDLGLQNPAVVCELALPDAGGAQEYHSIRQVSR